jgi:hypothetical protein
VTRIGGLGYSFGEAVKTKNGKNANVSSSTAAAEFVEPMLCLAVEKLPEGPAWQYELRLDGYRAIGVRTKAGVELWSRNKRDFSSSSVRKRRAVDPAVWSYPLRASICVGALSATPPTLTITA